MGRIEFAMWANEQGMMSVYVTFIGALCAVCSHATDYVHTRWEIAVFGLAFSVIMFLFEHPRSQREKGRTLERRFQNLTTPFVKGLGIFGRSYFVRFILYFAAGVVLLFQLATLMGGTCLLVTSIIYLVAGVRGEKWKACKKVATRAKTYTRAAPPSQAPPRLQVVNPSFEKEKNEMEQDSAYTNA